MGHEHLSPAGFERLLEWLAPGDPAGEVAIAHLAKELLREETYPAETALKARRRLVEGTGVPGAVRARDGNL